MKLEQFVSQQLSMGYPLHQHQGVWWQRQRRFYYKPAFNYQVLAPGSARPHPLRALVGYSHSVPPGTESNHKWPTMLVDWTSKERFSLENLAETSSDKRSQIRRQVRMAMSNLEIRLIHSIDQVIDDLQKINISAILRTEVGKPANYYVDRRETWEKFMRKLFALPDREWWGAFYQGKLVAYFYGFAVDGEWIIDTAKSMTEFLHLRPNDGLLFKTMESAINAHGCTRINYGGWTPDDPKLSQFKQKHGFQKVDIPAHLQLNPIAKLALNVRGELPSVQSPQKD